MFHVKQSSPGGVVIHVRRESAQGAVPTDDLAGLGPRRTGAAPNVSRETFLHAPMSSSEMFHVKRQNRGVLPGTPTPRGNCFGVRPVLIKSWNAAPCRTRPLTSSPIVAKASLSHRLGELSSGGSETTRMPPTLRNRTAHSAVTAGGPNDLAVTRSTVPVMPGSRATSSARPVIKRAPVGASGQRKTSSSSFIRFFIESSKIPLLFHRSRSTKPGSPPPHPRSRNKPGCVDSCASQHSAKPSA